MGSRESSCYVTDQEHEQHLQRVQKSVRRRKATYDTGGKGWKGWDHLWAEGSSVNIRMKSFYIHTYLCHRTQSGKESRCNQPHLVYWVGFLSRCPVIPSQKVTLIRHSLSTINNLFIACWQFPYYRQSDRCFLPNHEVQVSIIVIHTDKRINQWLNQGLMRKISVWNLPSPRNKKFQFGFLSNSHSLCYPSYTPRQPISLHLELISTLDPLYCETFLQFLPFPHPIGTSIFNFYRAQCSISPLICSRNGGLVTMTPGTLFLYFYLSN